MNRLQTLLQITGQPQAILPDKASVILQYLGQRSGQDIEFSGLGNPKETSAVTEKHGINRQIDLGKFPKYEVEDGVALIPVQGTLLHRWGTMLYPTSGATGYDWLAVQLENALADNSVHGILLDIDSPGGQVSGCFDFAEKVRAAREVKPVIALARDLAASGAYAIAAQANQFYLTQAAQVGSIGVVMAHLDASTAVKEAGYKVSLLHEGAHKVDGNSYQALPDEVRSKYQQSLSRSYALFINQVVKGRAGSDNPIDPEAVRATEAQVYDAEEAIELKLADQIVHPDHLISAFSATLNTGSIHMKKHERQHMAKTLKVIEEGQVVKSSKEESDDEVDDKENMAAPKDEAPDEDEEKKDAAKDDPEEENDDTSDKKKTDRKSEATTSNPLAIARLGQSAGLPETGFALAEYGLSVDQAQAVFDAVGKDRPSTPASGPPDKQSALGALSGALDTTPDPGVAADGALAPDGQGAAAELHPIVRAHAESQAFKSGGKSQKSKPQA